jgi:hypothetical protein
MLRAAIKAYYAHQSHRLPGTKLVNLGAYRLVHGEQKTVISSAGWLNLLAPEIEVEMNMIVHRRGTEYILRMQKCPKCQSLFERNSIDCWVTWYVYLIQGFTRLIPYKCSLSCSAQFENRINVPRVDPTRDSDTELFSPAT